MAGTRPCAPRGVDTLVCIDDDVRLGHECVLEQLLQPFAEHNPVSVVANSLRGLFHVDPSLTAADTRLALIQSGAWIVGILLVFVPLSVARYRRTTRG